MPMTKIFDLAYEIDGDRAYIEQDAGCGEVSRVELHAIHVRLLASGLGLLQGDADAWRRVTVLERRLRVLRDRISTLDDMLWAIPVYPPEAGASSSENTYSDATLTIADEFCADLGAGAAATAGVTQSHAASRQGTQSGVANAEGGAA